MNYKLIKTGEPLFKKYENDIYKLRHKVFKEELNWKVNSVDGDKEIDYFDSLDDVHYVIATDNEDKLIGCMRLLPTKNDYMLEKIFPSLYENIRIPKEDQIWEISRFAVDPSYRRKANILSFDKAALFLLKGMCEFSKQKNIDSYVAVTTDRIDRMLRRLKLDLTTVGKKIQMEDCNVVSIQVKMNDESFKAVDDAIIS